MGTATKTCQCGRVFTEEQSHGEHCFKCKVRSVGFTWHGPAGHSRARWNNSTIESEVREQKERIERAGGSMADWEPVK